jgi:FKBP-type peptidyl-prolyl cis-trans isomerase
LTAACTAKETAVISNSPPSIAEARFADTLAIDLAEFQRSETGLYWKDITIGEGTVVAAGQRVSAHYEGFLPDGSSFDHSRQRGPIQFAVVRGSVIDGWVEGVTGMRVGGTRQLIIPPALGYGEAGAGDVIPPNATLIFTVEVVGAQ